MVSVSVPAVEPKKAAEAPHRPAVAVVVPAARAAARFHNTAGEDDQRQKKRADIGDRSTDGWMDGWMDGSTEERRIFLGSDR
mmetsp:Transcript_24136/g.56895  ORF Transcript_24136/g.56895 Transcript_24136/m.56895 type:complete len:82 (-) Transcript_24136:62-307(-)